MEMWLRLAPKSGTLRGLLGLGVLYGDGRCHQLPLFRATFQMLLTILGLLIAVGVLYCMYAVWRSGVSIAAA